MLLTLIEIAEKLRVSKHTVQAWMSPSNPNYRPEFAAMARHSGRKTVFIEEDIDSWLNQRKGSLSNKEMIGISPYWLEKFMNGRGILKGIIKSPVVSEYPAKNKWLGGGVLGIDLEPLIIWLTDGVDSEKIFKVIKRSDGLMISTILLIWFLKRIQKYEIAYKEVKSFLLEENIFEYASYNEAALRLNLEINSMQGNDLYFQTYCACIANGAQTLLTINKALIESKGLLVISI